MYLIYGMHWMLNFVTSVEENPQAVLIRGLQEVNGPGRLTRLLELDRSFNGISLLDSQEIWVADPGNVVRYTQHPRVGIDYAGSPWVEKPWRYCLEDKPPNLF